MAPTVSVTESSTVTIIDSDTIKVNIIGTGPVGPQGPIGYTGDYTAAAGNTFAVGDIGILTSSGVVKSDATSEATAANLLLMATAVVPASTTGAFAHQGPVTITGHGKTIGVPLFLATVPGEVTETPQAAIGNILRVAAYAIDANTIYMRDDATFVEV